MLLIPVVLAITPGLVMGKKRKAGKDVLVCNDKEKKKKKWRLVREWTQQRDGETEGERV